MGLTCKVGGARSAFEGGMADAVAAVLDRAFGSEPDWEAPGGTTGFGDLDGLAWASLQARAVEELARDALPNLRAIEAETGGAYLPQNVRAVSLPVRAGSKLQCASLPGLRGELEALASRWGLADLEEDRLRTLADGSVPIGVVLPKALDLDDAVSLARLTLAANEAARRGCPLWLVGAGEG